MAAKKAPQQGPTQIDACEAEGIRLLNSSLVFTTPGGSHEVEIIEVEPYRHDQHDSFVDKFNSQTRQPGEFMVVYMMGNPLVFMVVDPDKQRIVHLKKFRFGAEEATMKGIQKKLGLKNTDISNLDGQMAGPQALVAITSKPTPEIREITKKAGKSVNSLGILSKGPAKQ